MTEPTTIAVHETKPTPYGLRETIARLWYVQIEPGEVECQRCYTWGDPGRTDWHEPDCQVVVLFACADAWAKQLEQMDNEVLLSHAETKRRLEAAEELLADVRCSAIEFEDPRVGYVTVQIDRGTWAALAAKEQP